MVSSGAFWVAIRPAV